jgi:hypothetical protein
LTYRLLALGDSSPRDLLTTVCECKVTLLITEISYLETHTLRRRTSTRSRYRSTRCRERDMHVSRVVCLVCAHEHRTRVCDEPATVVRNLRVLPRSLSWRRVARTVYLPRCVNTVVCTVYMCFRARAAGLTPSFFGERGHMRVGVRGATQALMWVAWHSTVGRNVMLGAPSHGILIVMAAGGHHKLGVICGCQAWT